MNMFVRVPGTRAEYVRDWGNIFSGPWMFENGAWRLEPVETKAMLVAASGVSEQKASAPVASIKADCRCALFNRSAVTNGGVAARSSRFRMGER